MTVIPWLSVCVYDVHLFLSTLGEGVVIVYSFGHVVVSSVPHALSSRTLLCSWDWVLWHVVCSYTAGALVDLRGRWPPSIIVSSVGYGPVGWCGSRCTLHVVGPPFLFAKEHLVYKL